VTSNSNSTKLELKTHVKLPDIYQIQGVNRPVVLLQDNSLFGYGNPCRMGDDAGDDIYPATQQHSMTASFPLIHFCII